KLGSFSKEIGKRFHQGIREMEKRYQGGWPVNVMADYCWMFKRESSSVESCSRKAKLKEFHTSK
ncbi:hypothetical protein Cfor_00675, partial [Coptotermes formosanus]